MLCVSEIKGSLFFCNDLDSDSLLLGSIQTGRVSIKLTARRKTQRASFGTHSIGVFTQGAMRYNFYTIATPSI